MSVFHVKCIFCAFLGCGQEPSLFMWWGLLEKVISRHNVVNVSFIPCTTLVVQGSSTNVISTNPDFTNAVFNNNMFLPISLKYVNISNLREFHIT